MSTLDVLKSEAAEIRARANSAGHPVSHSSALEEVARRRGFDSWRACLAVLRTGQADRPSTSPADPPPMRRHRSERWGFAVDVPARWDAYPPDQTNSPFEVARFLSHERGIHTLVVFKHPRDPTERVDVAIDRAAAYLADHGFGGFSRGRHTAGHEMIPFLDFDRPQGSQLWSCREYFFASETAYYVLGVGANEREAMVDVWNRLAEGFEILDPISSVPNRAAKAGSTVSLPRTGRSSQSSARAEARASRFKRTRHALQQVCTWLARALLPLAILVLASTATAASAQGVAASGELGAMGNGISGRGLGGNAVAGGVGTPLGFKESTPPVVGLPPPRFDPAIEYSNGLTDLEFGCLMQAREDLRHVVMAQPKNARAWFLMGVAYNSMGDRAAAAGAYQEALKADPKMIDAQRELAVSLALQGQADRAQSILTALKTSAANCGDCADASLLKSSVMRVEAALSGQLKDAMQPEATPAVCTALTTTAARNCFAAAKFGDPHGDGIAACTAAIGGGLPNEVKSRVLVDRGVIRLFHTQARPAIDDFDKAIAMNGEIADAYTNRGTAHLLMKEFDQARADIDKGLALGSGEPQRAYYNRGLADEHLGDEKAAYLDYTQAAMLDPSWAAPKGELTRFKLVDH